MNAHDILKRELEIANFVALGYLADLSDEDLLRRPAPGCNHINWQLGHLVVSEHNMMDGVLPGGMPPLPAGLAEKYTSETANIDDASKFATKAELLKVAAEQRAGLLEVLGKTTEADFDKPTGMDWAPTVGALLAMQAGHWLMHSGQWVVVRRQLGHKALF